RQGPHARGRSRPAHPGPGGYPAAAAARADDRRRDRAMSDGRDERRPTTDGRYGKFGGQYLPETLMPAVHELEAAFEDAKRDDGFQKELERLLKTWVGRPTPLTDAANLARAVGLRHVTLKREDLAHTGAHKINNAVGQALLATRMGKKRIVAETGAGQHGVASAAACALLGLECVVYM